MTIIRLKKFLKRTYTFKRPEIIPDMMDEFYTWNSKIKIYQILIFCLMNGYFLILKDSKIKKRVGQILCQIKK